MDSAEGVLPLQVKRTTGDRDGDECGAQMRPTLAKGFLVIRVNVLLLLVLGRIDDLAKKNRHSEQSAITTIKSSDSLSSFSLGSCQLIRPMDI